MIKLVGIFFQAGSGQGSIYWKIPPPPGGEEKYQPMSFGGKNMKRVREKWGKCKRKRKKEERKRKKEARKRKKEERKRKKGERK